MADYFPSSSRQELKVLDVAAGTGFVAENVRAALERHPFLKHKSSLPLDKTFLKTILYRYDTTTSRNPKSDPNRTADSTAERHPKKGRILYKYNNRVPFI